MGTTLSRTWKLVSLLVVTALVPSCESGSLVDPAGEPDGDVPRPTALEIGPLLDPITEDDTVVVSALVKDQLGRPIPEAPLVWTSSDEEVAHLLADGGTTATLIAKKPGSTTVTASYGTLTVSTQVGVHERPADLVYVSGSGQTANSGETLRDGLVVKAVDRRGTPLGGVALRFVVTQGGGSVSPSSGVTDADGQLRAAWTLGEPGPQTVEARASAQPRLKNLKDSVVVFTAEAIATVERIEVEPSSASLEEGATLRMDADAVASDGSRVSEPSVTWRSTDTTVLTVDASGLVRAKKAGRAQAIAVSTAPALLSDTAHLLVTEPAATVEGLEVRPATVIMDTGGTHAFRAVVLLSDGGEQAATVTWSATGGTVRSDGLYTAGAAAGSHRVIASHAAGFADTAAVTVVAPVTRVARVIVSPATDSLAVGVTATFTATALDAGGGTLTGRSVTWSSLHPTVATVDGSGVVSGVAPGRATITATSEGVSGTATAVVVASPRADPATVHDLRVDSVASDAIMLSWTEVDDGTGGPADYALRYGSPTISWDAAQATEVRVAGTAVGRRVTHTFRGLLSVTGYQFRLAAYRETGEGPVYGELSNTVGATTPARRVARVSASPSSHRFTRIGETVPITATAYDDAGAVLEAAELTFGSSDASVAGVDAAGLVTARALGIASIAVAAACCPTAMATVAVEVTSPDADSYYVSTTGSDANPGTETAPWRTIAHGLEQLQPGQTLFVRGGTYEEDIKRPAIQGGRPDARIRVAAYPGERPVLRGLLWLDRPSYWTIDGLNVTWASRNLATDHMVKMTNGVGWIYENSELWGARSFAGLLVYGSIRGEPADWVVRGNCIHDIWTDPIHHKNGDHNLYINTGTSAGAGLIERNLLFSAPNGQNVKLGYGRSDPQPEDGAAHVTVRYNTMVGSLKNLMLADATHDITIERNIVVGSSEDYAIRAYRLTGEGNVFRDNVFGPFGRLQYGDSGYGLVTDGGGNHFPLDPRFDTVSCTDLRPTNPTAQQYGRYAPGH